MARCQKSREVRIGKTLIFSIDERVFSKYENRFGLIIWRNIKGMSFSRWMTMVLFMNRLSIFDSTRTTRFKPGLLALVLVKV